MLAKKRSEKEKVLAVYTHEFNTGYYCDIFQQF